MSMFYLDFALRVPRLEDFFFLPFERERVPLRRTVGGVGVGGVGSGWQLFV